MLHGFAGETSVSAPVNPLSPEGIIKNWFLVGTFPNEKIENVKPEEVSRSGFSQDFLQSIGGESAAIIKKDTVAVYKDAKGTEYKAKICAVTAMEDGVLDFGKTFGAMDSKTAYAFSCLESDKDGPAYCWFGSDDSAKIWINGELVQNVWTPARALWPWENKFTVKLHKGQNFVLVKAENRRISLRLFDESHHALGLLNVIDKDLRVLTQKKEISIEERTFPVTVDYLPADKALVSPITVECCDFQGKAILNLNETTGNPFNVNLPENAKVAIKITAKTTDAKGTLRVGETFIFRGDFAKSVAELAQQIQAIAKRFNITKNPATSANAPEYIKHHSGRVMQALKFLSVTDLPHADRVFRQMADIGKMITELEQGKDVLYSASEHRFFNTYQNKDGKVEAGYEYYVCLPKEFATKKTNWPLILALHGAGERGDNIEKIKREGLLKEISGLNASLKKEVFPGIVVAPQCPTDVKWWTMEDLKSLLDEISNILPVDKDRIYVTGMSMGGIGTWNMITTYPDYFAAAIPICGRGDPAKAEKIKDMPLWVFHGEKDTMLPLKRSQDMVAALKTCGSKVEFTIYPDTGHDSWTPTYSNPQIYEWLLGQKKGQHN